MSRYDNNIKCAELRRLLEARNYKKAYQVLETIEVDLVKNVTNLNAFAEVYRKAGKYDEAMDMLEQIYERTRSRIILYKMANVAILQKDFEEADRLLKEMEERNPEGEEVYVLRYRIAKAQGADYQTRIKCLEEFREYEYIEEWAYELATLYHKAAKEYHEKGDFRSEARMVEKCVDECSDIVLWFGEGVIVEKAKLLRMYHLEGSEALERYGVNLENAKERVRAQTEAAQNVRMTTKELAAQISEFAEAERKSDLKKELVRELLPTMDLEQSMKRDLKLGETADVQEEISRMLEEQERKDRTKDTDAWLFGRKTDERVEALEKKLQKEQEKEKATSKGLKGLFGWRKRANDEEDSPELDEIASMLYHDERRGAAGSAIKELPAGNSSNTYHDERRGAAGSAIKELPAGNSSNTYHDERRGAAGSAIKELPAGNSAMKDKMYEDQEESQDKNFSGMTNVDREEKVKGAEKKQQEDEWNVQIDDETWEGAWASQHQSHGGAGGNAYNASGQSSMQNTAYGTIGGAEQRGMVPGGEVEGNQNYAPNAFSNDMQGYSPAYTQGVTNPVDGYANNMQGYDSAYGQGVAGGYTNDMQGYAPSFEQNGVNPDGGYVGNPQSYDSAYAQNGGMDYTIPSQTGWERPEKTKKADSLSSMIVQKKVGEDSSVIPVEEIKAALHGINKEQTLKFEEFKDEEETTSGKSVVVEDDEPLPKVEIKINYGESYKYYAKEEELEEETETSGDVSGVTSLQKVEAEEKLPGSLSEVAVSETEVLASEVPRTGPSEALEKEAITGQGNRDVQTDTAASGIALGQEKPNEPVQKTDEENELVSDMELDSEMNFEEQSAPVKPDAVEEERPVRAGVDLEKNFPDYMRYQNLRKQIIEIFTQMEEHEDWKKHFVITGDAKTGKTTFAKNLTKVMKKMGAIKQFHFACATGDQLNKMNLLDKKNKLKGACMIIENAGDLYRPSVVALKKLMDELDGNFVVILEDNQTAMERFLLENYDVLDYFHFTFRM